MIISKMIDIHRGRRDNTRPSRDNAPMRSSEVVGTVPRYGSKWRDKQVYDTCKLVAFQQDKEAAQRAAPNPLRFSLASSPF